MIETHACSWHSGFQQTSNETRNPDNSRQLPEREKDTHKKKQRQGRKDP